LSPLRPVFSFCCGCDLFLLDLTHFDKRARHFPVPPLFVLVLSEPSRFSIFLHPTPSFWFSLKKEVFSFETLFSVNGTPPSGSPVVQHRVFFSCCFPAVKAPCFFPPTGLLGVSRKAAFGGGPPFVGLHSENGFPSPGGVGLTVPVPVGTTCSFFSFCPSLHSHLSLELMIKTFPPPPNRLFPFPHDPLPTKSSGASFLSHRPRHPQIRPLFFRFIPPFFFLFFFLGLILGFFS